MKKLLLQSIVCATALLPFTQAQAADPAGAKRYGDFLPGKTFSFKVTNVTSAKAGVTGGTVKAPVPSGIPKFTKGQKVTFTIGAKGELKGPGFSTSFSTGSITSNAYVDKQSGTTLPDQAIVFKNYKKQPEGVNLTFNKVNISGFSTSVHLVNYTLE